MKATFFPYALLRIGGEPVTLLGALNAEKLWACMNDIYRLKDQIDVLKNNLCDSLYQVISITEEYEVKKGVITVKRNIFNQRKSSASLILQLSSCVPEHLLNSVLLYQQQLELLDNRKTELSDVYNEEMENIENRFQNIINNNNLLNGLLLGSHDLLQSAEKYIDTEKRKLLNRKNNVEIGLLKYYSRMVTKTSPFSSFNNIGFAAFQPAAPKGLLVEEKQLASFVNLSNYMLRKIQHLLLKFDPFVQYQFIRLNTTSKVTGTKIIFLLNFNNSESFQELDRSEIIDFILDLYKRQPAIRFGELVTELMGIIDAEKEELDNYIHKLVTIGFLEFDLKPNRKEPDWLPALRKHINEINSEDEHLTRFSDQLEKAEQLLSQYRNVKENYKERREVLVAIHRTLFYAFYELHKAAGLPEHEREAMNNYSFRIREKKAVEKAVKEPAGMPEKRSDMEDAGSGKEDRNLEISNNTIFGFTPENVLYEETVLENDLYIDMQTGEQLADILSKLNSSLRYINLHSHKCNEFRRFFVEEFGTDKEVTLLDFYDRYYRIRNAAEQGPSEEDHNFYRTIEEWQNCLFEELEGKMDTSGEEIHISSDWIESANSNLVNKPVIRNYISRSSFNAFIQCGFEGNRISTEKPVFVLNAGLFPGFGKLFSRFLYYENNGVRNALMQNCTDGECIFAEYSDNSFFNANIHPPIAAYEIESPGGQVMRSPDKVLSLSNLMVKFDRERDYIHLYDSRSGKKVVFLNLDFQDLRGRSPLFRFLSSCFTVPQPGNHFILLEILSDKTRRQINANISFQPRLVFNNYLVIRRKCWEVNIEEFSSFSGMNDEATLFYAITEWRKRNDIPEEVFVKLLEYDEKEGKRKEFRKPQYIHFKSPLLVRLLVKNFIKAENAKRISFTEFLPTDSQLLSSSHGKYVSEFLFEWLEEYDA